MANDEKRVNPGKDPAGVPRLSPEQREKLQQATEAANKAMQMTDAELSEAVNYFKNLFSGEQGEKAFRQIVEVAEYVAAHPEAIEAAEKKTQEIEKLVPYIEKELDKPENQELTIYDVLDIFDGNKSNERAAAVLSAAQAAAKAEHLATLPLVEVQEKGTKDSYFPLDKINSKIWRYFQKADKNGQIALRFDTSRKNDDRDVLTMYSINFEKLEQIGAKLSRELTSFDKRVYIAAGALYTNSYDVATVGQIYAAMGNRSSPNTRDVQRIRDSLNKMMMTEIMIDNTKEVTANYKYPHYKYFGALLPMEYIEANVNGVLVDCAIHFFREPPLLSFARGRNQITTIRREVLESPLSKTEKNLRIDNYLIEQIAKIKKGSRNNPKILFDTLFKECDITASREKQRAKQRATKGSKDGVIFQYLDHYKECGYIKGYQRHDDGVTITIDRPKKKNTEDDRAAKIAEDFEDE